MQELDQLSADIDSATSDVSLSIDVESTVDEVQAELDSLEATGIDVPIEADTSEAEAAIEGIGGDVPPIEVPVDVPDDAEGQLDGIAEGIGNVQAAAAGLAGVGLGAALGGVLSDFGEAERVGTIAGQVFENVGSQINVTADQVQDLALSVQEYTGFSDEAVTQAAQVVASFQNISNSADGTVDTFDRTVTTSADLAVAMGQDIPSAARTLGRALADPEKAAARLRRQGIILTEQQQESIAAFVEVGDVASAQGVILDAIEAKYGGVAEAAGGTLTGSLDRAREAFGNISEVIGGSAAAFLDPLVAGLASVGEGFTHLSPEVQGAIGALAAFTLASGTAVGGAIALRAAVGSELAQSLKTAAVELRAFAASSAAAQLIANPYVAVAGLTALAGAFIYTSGVSSEFNSAVDDLGASLADVAAPAVDSMAAALGELATVLQLTASTADGLGDVVDAIDAVVEAVPGVEDGSSAFQAFTDSAVDMVQNSVPGLRELNSVLGPLTSGLEFLGINLGTFEKAAAAPAESVKGTAEEIAAADARLQEIAATLPTVAEAFGEVQSAAPALEEAFGIVNASSDPAILAQNLQAQADLLNVFFNNLNSIAEAGFAQLAGTLQQIGPEAAGLAFQLAAALESGDLTEAARLQNAISNLEDASGRITGLGTETGAGFTQAAEGAISTGSEAVGAAADAAGQAAALGVAAGFSIAVSLISAQMTLASVAVAVGGVQMTATATQVGSQSGLALGQGFATSAPIFVGVGFVSVNTALITGSISTSSVARSAGLSIGRALGQGIEQGIREQTASIASEARAAVLDAADAARAAAQVSSPSKLFATIGEQMGAGLALGFERGASALVAEAQAVTFNAAGAVGSTSTSVGGVVVNQVIEGGMTPGDARPIRKATRDGVRDGLAVAFDVANA